MRSVVFEGPRRIENSANDGPFLRRYQSVAQINLCAERQRNLNEGIAIAAQVLSWLQWVRRLEFIGAPDVFGDDRGVTQRMGDNPFLCYLVTHRVVEGAGAPGSGAGDGDVAGAGSKTKRSVCGEFQDILEYYGRVPEAVLQCLSLYILPSLYGALGAVLSTIRYVRGRVAGSMLTYVDRGRIQQDWLLGLVLGAVIGLFADYVAKANPVEGIALSALALLAGYNVSAVFDLFEDLSGRILRKARRAGPRTHPAVRGTPASRGNAATAMAGLGSAGRADRRRSGLQQWTTAFADGRNA